MPFFNWADAEENGSLSVCASWSFLSIMHFAFELPLMVKKIIAVSPQPDCCVHYKNKNMSSVRRVKAAWGVFEEISDVHSSLHFDLD